MDILPRLVEDSQIVFFDTYHVEYYKININGWMGSKLFKAFIKL